VKALLERAAQVLETARFCASAGGGSEWTLLEDGGGRWQMIAGADHAPGALAWSHGALSIFQVRRRGAAVQVMAWEAGQTCLLEAHAAGQTVRAAIGEQRLYASGGAF